MSKARPIGFGYNTPNILPPGKLTEASGTSPLMIPRALPKKPKKLTIYGNTIGGVGVGDYNEATGLYEIPITISGINILDTTQERVVLSGTIPEDQYTARPGTVSFKTHSYSYDTNKFGIPVAVKKNTNYRISYITTEGRPRLYIYDASGNVIYTNNNYTGGSFNTGNAETIYIGFRSNAWSVYTELNSMILSEGADTVEYEQYRSPDELCTTTAQPVYAGQSINASLPSFSAGTSIITVDTSVPPAEISCLYYT